MQDNSKKIAFVAEDEIDIQPLLKNVLERLGYEVVIAANNAEAWNAIESQKFDLGIMDLHLQDGPTSAGVIQAFRGHNPTSPMIMTSGSDVDDQMTVGGDHCHPLPKAFDLKKLMALVKDLMDSQV